MENPGIISVVPIIITLALALWSRNVILGLFMGVFSGVIIINGPNPVTAVSCQ
jgi:Na+/H+ antiporter NhaC